MHVLFRKSHGLEETEIPVDLDQSPGDLVVLSFSDSDLGAFSAGWHLGTRKTFVATVVAIRPTHPRIRVRYDACDGCTHPLALPTPREAYLHSGLVAP